MFAGVFGAPDGTPPAPLATAKGSFVVSSFLSPPALKTGAGIADASEEEIPPAPPKAAAKGSSMTAVTDAAAAGFAVMGVTFAVTANAWLPKGSTAEFGAPDPEYGAAVPVPAASVAAVVGNVAGDCS